MDQGFLSVSGENVLHLPRTGNKVSDLFRLRTSGQTVSPDSSYNSKYLQLACTVGTNGFSG